MHGVYVSYRKTIHWCHIILCELCELFSTYWCLPYSRINKCCSVGSTSSQPGWKYQGPSWDILMFAGCCILQSTRPKECQSLEEQGNCMEGRMKEKTIGKNTWSNINRFYHSELSLIPHELSTGKLIGIRFRWSSISIFFAGHSYFSWQDFFFSPACFFLVCKWSRLPGSGVPGHRSRRHRNGVWHVASNTAGKPEIPEMDKQWESIRWRKPETSGKDGERWGQHGNIIVSEVTYANLYVPLCISFCLSWTTGRSLSALSVCKLTYDIFTYTYNQS